MATGIGSVNAANLVKARSSIKKLGSTTTPGLPALGCGSGETRCVSYLLQLRRREWCNGHIGTATDYRQTGPREGSDV
jgi:hypothetical protein